MKRLSATNSEATRKGLPWRAGGEFVSPPPYAGSVLSPLACSEVRDRRILQLNKPVTRPTPERAKTEAYQSGRDDPGLTSQTASAAMHNLPRGVRRMSGATWKTGSDCFESNSRSWPPPANLVLPVPTPPLAQVPLSCWNPNSLSYSAPASASGARSTPICSSAPIRARAARCQHCLAPNHLLLAEEPK